MKHLKTYLLHKTCKTSYLMISESNKLYKQNNTPKVGDYVLIDPMCAQEKFEPFFKKEIGQIIDYVGDDYEQYHVKFDKQLPGTEKQKDNFLTFEETEILSFSKNKEEVLLKLNIDKYNL